VPGSSRLGHITLDTISNILYVSDWNIKKIFKININTNTPSVLVNSGIETPVGVLFDPNYNRIILLTFDANTPVKAVNPSNGQVTNITGAGYNYLDAIARDKYGCVYVSSFTQGVVYRFDSVFSAPPEIISSGHNGPSGFGYNALDHILGVTNYNSNSYSLVTLPVISVKNISNKTGNFILLQNYPNPFNNSTILRFELSKASNVKLVIYDIRGKEAGVLLNGKLDPGIYETVWQAVNYSSGIYFYKLVTDKHVSTGKMCLTK
jgi:DNA-binding beta-propeller fold protein YncE